jgi:hypothetical protein
MFEYNVIGVRATVIARLGANPAQITAAHRAAHRLAADWAGAGVCVVPTGEAAREVTSVLAWASIAGALADRLHALSRSNMSWLLPNCGWRFGHFHGIGCST